MHHQRKTQLWRHSEPICLDVVGDRLIVDSLSLDFLFMCGVVTTKKTTTIESMLLANEIYS